MLTAAALLLAGFAALGLLLRTGSAVQAVDMRVQAALRPLRRRPVVLAFDWLTQAGTGGSGAAVALVASALLWSAGRGLLVLPLWVCFVGAEATTWSTKFMFKRRRPAFLEGITAGSPSYPSAHATVAVSVYGFLALAAAAAVPRPGGVLLAAAAWVATIAFSRLLLSLHYLSDVVGGAMVGAAWLLVCWHWALAL